VERRRSEAAEAFSLTACRVSNLTGVMADRQKYPGLAKAFFYAGSRVLLVSHCPVVSDAAVSLTTRLLSTAKTGLTRSEAHRIKYR